MTSSSRSTLSSPESLRLRGRGGGDRKKVGFADSPQQPVRVMLRGKKRRKECSRGFYSWPERNEEKRGSSWFGSFFGWEEGGEKKRKKRESPRATKARKEFRTQLRRSGTAESEERKKGKRTNLRRSLRETQGHSTKLRLEAAIRELKEEGKGGGGERLASVHFVRSPQELQKSASPAVILPQWGEKGKREKKKWPAQMMIYNQKKKKKKIPFVDEIEKKKRRGSVTDSTTWKGSCRACARNRRPLE